jgi:aldehyde dehydrogenase (NAD+)
MSESQALLSALGLSPQPAALQIGARASVGEGPERVVRSPIDGRELARFRTVSNGQIDRAIAEASGAFASLRALPAPRRGELVRRFGEQLRAHKAELAALVTAEVGKIGQEALGEVQEMIDICEFATGLSRQLYGLTIASERPLHRLTEQWHPLGPVGVITAFNFPVAVWAWNASIALVCGDPVVWKPSEKAPLCALACHRLLCAALAEMSDIPDAAATLVIGDGREAGAHLAASRELPLISATGSVAMGRSVAQVVAARLGRSLLELGGNNGMVVAPSADLELALRSIVFAAVGTCGQRCTSLRRLIVQREVYTTLRDRLLAVYARLPIGDPRQPATLVGPLIDEAAYLRMQQSLAAARAQGGRVVGGERLQSAVPSGGVYVQPALVEIDPGAPIVQEETFAPVLYLMRYESFDEALAIHNGVPQGLASAIFTNDVREAERFCSAGGSDCGIVNVNIGTSGAEIGGAFGGEKLTGGGRVAGSDSWKAYMRRATNTVNYSSALPLAQGIHFDV